MAFLPAEPFGLGDGDALKTYLLQRFLHLIQFERLMMASIFFIDPPIYCVMVRGARTASLKARFMPIGGARKACAAGRCLAGPLGKQRREACRSVPGDLLVGLSIKSADDQNIGKLAR